MEAFAAPVTPAIERANRLLALKAMPGFIELMRLGQELVNEATAVMVDFPGWDKDQMAILKARAQAAKEYHAMLLCARE